MHILLLSHRPRPLSDPKITTRIIIPIPTNIPVTPNLLPEKITNKASHRWIPSLQNPRVHADTHSRVRGKIATYTHQPRKVEPPRAVAMATPASLDGSRATCPTPRLMRASSSENFPPGAWWIVSDSALCNRIHTVGGDAMERDCCGELPPGWCGNLPYRGEGVVSWPRFLVEAWEVSRWGGYRWEWIGRCLFWWILRGCFMMLDEILEGSKWVFVWWCVCATWDKSVSNEIET